MMIKMQSMALDEEESYDAKMPIPMPEKPEFPYELRISLTDVTMKKLGIDPAEAVEGVGGYVTLHAIARITHASASASDGGDDCCRVELQIEQLAIDGDFTDSPAEEAAEQAAPKRGISALYKTQ